MLVHSPLPAHYISADHSSLISEIRDIADNREINLLDYSRLSLDDKNHFYDNHHLNQAGVEIFNNVLLKDLLSKYPQLKNSKNNN